MIELKWHEREVMVEVNSVLKAVNKAVANNIMEDAKQILERDAETTSERGLLKQFQVKRSKYKEGGYLVYCQGPGKWWPPYHASFVELGAPGRTKRMQNPSYDRSQKRGPGNRKRMVVGRTKTAAIPFMRPAYKKNKRKANRMFQDALDKL